MAISLLFLPSAFAGLEWETTFHEVRPAPGEKFATADYKYRNTGTDTQKISGIQTSCGCTTAKADKKEIPPGDTGVVQVRFDFGNRKGEQVKMAAVRTSDRVTHKLILRVFLPER